MQVKLIGTPSAPHARLLGSVRRGKVNLPGPSVRGAREVPRLLGEIFASTRFLARLVGCHQHPQQQHVPLHEHG